ncbi:MAG: corrinoid protein [Deltaproteobacteria bacterium]|nr:corrinoid protein [Deltaproteobacteria bacterium]
MLESIYEDVVRGDLKRVTEHVKAALEAGLDVDNILNRGMIAAMDEVGRRFESGKIFVPEMIMAARAMLAGVDIMKPHLLKGKAAPLGKVVIGTVKGDLHDIGKNLVIMMLEATGFEVVDLGIDVPESRFLEAVRKHNAQLVALSGLLTTAMSEMRATAQLLNRELKKDGIREQVTVMIGGAPVTQSFADEIGADLYAPDASSAARKAKERLRKA